MPFISISIDIIGSTDAKAKLRGHSSHIGTKATDLYESFQKQVLRVEETFWTMLRSSNLDINMLFLIKNIGDEVWYTYDLEELEEYERRAAVARMIESLVALQTKHFDLVAGPPENPWNWRDVDPNTLLRIDLPLKITMDVINDALEVATLREKYLAPHVASLLSPLEKPTRFVKAGDDRYINLLNRLGISSQVKTKEKVFSSIRSDYIGWEIDRFFRLTKAAIKGGVLIGPEILSDFDTNKLIVSTAPEDQTKPGWSISNIRFRVCCGQGSFTSLGENYMLARRYLSADEQKGVGAGCDIAIVYWKYQKDVGLQEIKEKNMCETDLTVERYRFVTHRQEYHADRMCAVFNLFIKIFVSLVAGSLLLVSTKSKLSLSSSDLHGILKTIAFMLTFLGAVSIVQIVLGLWSWIGFRHAECDINTKAPPVRWHWWLYEALYCLAIGIALLISWWGVSVLPTLV